MAIRSDVDVRRANELDHLVGTNEAVVEDHIGLHSDFLRQRLQVRPIVITLAAENVRVGPPATM
jgi:hypothetical protein